MRNDQEYAVQASNDKSSNDNPLLIPAVDISEDETGITLLADLPGASKETVQIRLDGDKLTIQGDIQLDLSSTTEARYAEVRLSGFRRSFTLSRELDIGKSESSLKDGVLKLRIPKAEHVQRRRIDVKVE